MGFLSDRDYDSDESYYNYMANRCEKRIQIDFVSDGYNEQLMDCDFIKNNKERSVKKNENFVKKSRKRMKNKKKYGAYRRRQHDKKGNVKNNKRSKRQRQI